MAKSDSQMPKPAVPPGARKRPKATLSSRYLLPLATAMLVGAGFVVYYLTYVQQHREYLLNRDYRVLATLGDQMSETLANQIAILKSYVDALEDGGFDDTSYRVSTFLGIGGKHEQFHLTSDLSEVGPSATGGPSATVNTSDMLHSFAPRLNHVLIRNDKRKLQEEVLVKPDLVRSDGEWSFQLAAVDNDGKHQASATISLKDLSQSFSPSIMDTFDDVLIAKEDGKIVFQKQRIGLHFSSLSDLVKNAAAANATQGEADEDGNPKVEDSGAPRDVPGQLIETYLAGIPYLVFLEPITVDLNPGHDAMKRHTQRFTLVGLAPSRHFRWESLAISYRAVMFLSSVLLLLCLSIPVLKIFFLNERGRLLKSEVVLLPLLFVTIAGALTSICLQTFYFNLRHDDTDMEIENLSGQMQENINGEISAMRDQLIAACLVTRSVTGNKKPKPDIDEDLGFTDGNVIRTNVLETEFSDAGKTGCGSCHRPIMRYPYFYNVFWTDSQGRQIVKWSVTDRATPLIDVSRLPFFRNLESDNQYFFINEARPFRFDSLLPPNQDNYVGVLGMRMSDCSGDANDKGFAFLSARTLSLIDPILPPGVGFALVDDTGWVVFHSDKYRNNRENFLVESSNDPELTASLYGHSNEQNFSLYYRGNEVRARVVPVLGVNQSPWSLIVYKDARYSQTYDLEILTMAGALLILYIGIPAAIAFLLYLLAKPVYVPGWLWPSESSAHIYRFQIAAGTVMVVLSAALVFLSATIEQSLYAAAAAGYVTLIIVFWSALSDRPSSLSKNVFAVFCVLAAIAIVAFPMLKGWIGVAVPLGLVLIAFAWALRGRKHLAVAGGWFSRLSYQHLYNIRALVLLSVVGILPSESFFRNSMLLEDRLHIRAAQLQAAVEWNSRERKIENLIKEVPDLDGKIRCAVGWDSYLVSYFGTYTMRGQHLSPNSPSDLDSGFLRFAHFLHHSYNDIGAREVGVIREPEGAYLPKAPEPEQVDSPIPEWEWQWVKGDPYPLRLRVHEGAAGSNPCAAKNESDLVVLSRAPTGHLSALSNVFTWLGVTIVVSVLYRLVTRRIFLLDLGEPLSQYAGEAGETLKGASKVLVLTASRQDWSQKLAGLDASRIDLRELSADPDWGEKFDVTKLRGEGPVIVENFDWELGSPEFDRQRLVLTERLVAQSRRAIFVSGVDPSPFLIERHGSDAAADAGRWAAVLGVFRRLNLGHQPSWPLGEKIDKESSLWTECSVQPELHRIGEELWHAWNGHEPQPEHVISEVGERAAQYYYLWWRSCTQEECFVLAGLARDGMVNARNTASLRQLVRRRLIVRAPQFQIMNESFRRFVLAEAVSMQEEWDAEAAGSGWGKARGPFATALVLVGLFLLGTQQQFLQTSTGLLTAAGGGVAALLKLIGFAQGRSSDK